MRRPRVDSIRSMVLFSIYRLGSATADELECHLAIDSEQAAISLQDLSRSNQIAIHPEPEGSKTDVLRFVITAKGTRAADALIAESLRHMTDRRAKSMADEIEDLRANRARRPYLEDLALDVKAKRPVAVAEGLALLGLVDLLNQRQHHRSMAV